MTLFLLIVFGLLLGAGIKNRLEKAGLVTEMGWDNGRRWWQVSDGDERHTDRADTELGMASAKTGVRVVEIWGVGIAAIMYCALCTCHIWSQPMGSLCSKQGNHSGTQYAVPLERPAHRQALDADAQRPSNPRAAAAAAAEQRLKAVSRATVND